MKILVENHRHLFGRWERVNEFQMSTAQNADYVCLQ